MKPFLFVAVITGLPATAVGGDFFIHDGDRVVFLGDSITRQRLYTTYIEGYALTRHPQWKLSFRNTGWGGDTAWLRQRAHPDEKMLFAAGDAEQQQMVDKAVTAGLERDVLPLKPTAITIDFGMNDHAYQAFRKDIFGAYVRSQTKLGEVLKANGARVAFVTPQPIEDKRPDPDQDPKNESLRKFSDGLKEVAAKEDSVFVDEFDPYMAIMMHERKENPEANIGRGDAVHPGATGHTLMAWAILKGLGATPLVSRADIDASGKRVTASEACKIEQLQVNNGTVSFDRLDEALPMPIDPPAEPALKLAPILDDLDRYELKITGLPAGAYELSIDGESAGKTTADALAQGWNIAEEAGPITKQSRELLKLVFKKNDIYYKRWRDVQLYSFPPWTQNADTEKAQTAELARLDKEISETEDQINQLRQLKSHHFELKPAGQ